MAYVGGIQGILNSNLRAEQWTNRKKPRKKKKTFVRREKEKKGENIR